MENEELRLEDHKRRVQIHELTQELIQRFVAEMTKFTDEKLQGKHDISLGTSVLATATLKLHMAVAMTVQMMGANPQLFNVQQSYEVMDLERAMEDEDGVPPIGGEDGKPQA